MFQRKFVLCFQMASRELSLLPFAAIFVYYFIYWQQAITQFLYQTTSLAFHLIFFALTSAYYLFDACWHQKDKKSHGKGKENDGLDFPKPQTVIAKCLPTLCLCGFVWSSNFDHRTMYPYLIMAGLAFSLIGDALLVYSSLDKVGTYFFQHGLLNFAIGRICYTFAFGFNPFNMPLLIPNLLIGILVYVFLLPDLPSKTYRIFTALYILLMALMNWRGMSRVHLVDVQSYWTTEGALIALLAESNWTGCFGTILFCVSDMILVTDKFEIFKIPKSNFIIMLTYFLAQLGISLSSVYLPEPDLQDIWDADVWGVSKVIFGW